MVQNRPRTLPNHLGNELVIGAATCAFKHMPTWIWAFLAGGRGLCTLWPRIELHPAVLFDFLILLFTLLPCLFYQNKLKLDIILLLGPNTEGQTDFAFLGL